MRAVTALEMQELDRRAIEVFGIPSIVLMENAGRGVSEVALRMLNPASGKRIAIFCGTGNNGGDGFVAGRYLAKKGLQLNVYIVGEKSRIKADAGINLNIMEKMGIIAQEIAVPVDIEADLVIDAIFGTGFKGKVKDPAASIISYLNKSDIPVLSVDVPSGLDADTGEALPEAVRARKTVTMQFPKKGFYIGKGPEYVGEVITVDIGIPCEVA